MKKIFIKELKEIFCLVNGIKKDIAIENDLFNEELEITMDSLTFIRFLVAVEEEYNIEFSRDVLIIPYSNLDELIQKLAQELMNINSYKEKKLKKEVKD